MKIGRRHLLLFIVGLIFFAHLIRVSSRRAVHAVLAANLEAAARAQESGILRSMEVGLRDGNEAPLSSYLQGCIGSYGAAYAAAVSKSGVVVAAASVSDLGRDVGDRLESWGASDSAVSSTESSLGGRPVLELAFRGPRGGLLLGYELKGVLLTESRIAMKIFLFTGAVGALALGLLLLLMRDLARREEGMRRTEKLSALGRLAAGIAHEINNPLGSILGFAQAATARLSPSDALTPPLRAIEEEAVRCRNIVQSLLTFSRQDAGAAEVFDLARAVEDTLSMIEAQARVQGVAIVRELEPGLRAAGNRGQIQQVIMNLCSNAVDAMPEGGRVTIRSGGKKGGGVYLEVWDEGSGVPPELRPRIFDPFFTTKEVGKGTGLGLSLVHEIVIRHRGTVEVDFPSGGGSTFRVTLPCAAPVRSK
ncbi:MAG: ATP-binding protein [Elusimicrobiota bacterium]|nr:ATP-binding protein [Elusimicrobiota bacterium]